MTNVLIINGHQPYPSSPGRLNAAFCSKAQSFLEDRGCSVSTVNTSEPWEADTQVERQLWADLILLQFPLNSMGLPWSLKKYLDEVYTAGMDSRLAKGDGRTRSDPRKQYGSGGHLQGRFYMLSVTCNAPENAFSDPNQTLFAGRSLDDLLSPVHINFAFFALSKLPTFAAFDVKKTPSISADFERFEALLESNLERARSEHHPSHTRPS